MEYRPTDPRRRSTGTHRQARHANDGWIADHRVSYNLDASVGTAVERLCVGDNDCYSRIRGGRFRRRLFETCSSQESGPDGPAEVVFSAHDRIRDLADPIYFNEVLSNEIFVECQHS